MGKIVDRLRDKTLPARISVVGLIASPAEIEMTSASAQANKEADGVVELRSLSPKYNPVEHEGYVQVLERELSKTGDEVPLNVALTGHFGSGKSSVLIEVQRRLVQAELKVINLSLPSLGIGDGRIPKDGDQSRNKTNLIQKEIVKQLLYRRLPSDTPASRYKRLDRFDRRIAVKRGAAVGLFALFGALLAGLPGKLQKAVPAKVWKWVDAHTFEHASVWLHWLSLVVVFVLAMMLIVWLSRALQQRLRVTELAAGAGPAKVKLSEPTASYFDEYLDEIVYFFQMSGTKMVIFEDLDRFKDPHIFETLRELNLLLNNAQQTGPEPIRFVYAIRDSIFEQLDAKPSKESSVDSEDDEEDEVAPSLQTVNERTETRRLVTTNRTKFFDLVVPIVPFISHRTSRELMLSELESIPEDHRPGREVVDLVSAHITDMRLIKNIANEYDIFRTRILREGGLKELTPDKLFASIVYKNQFLIDYENIRNGTSLLDDVYRGYREWVAQSSEAARLVERRARNELRRLNVIGTRSRRLGTRLQDVLAARAGSQYKVAQISGTGGSYSMDDLLTVDFWTKYLEDQGDLTVNYQMQGYYGNESVQLAFNKVQTLIGEDLDPSAWDKRDRQEVLGRIAKATADQARYAHASLADAMNATAEYFKRNDQEMTVGELADGLFPGADIVTDLLRAGHVDENYTLYVTQFPGDSSASAMNFIIKAVQPNVMDIEYHFGEGAEASESDIEAALDAEQNRILNGQSAYNLEIFDYLLAKGSDLLEDPIRRLAANANEDRKFIDSYVDSGKEVAKFVSLLAGKWRGVFEHILGEAPDEVDLALLDSALQGAGGLAYALNDEQRDVFIDKLGELKSVKVAQTLERAKSMAQALDEMDVVVTNLAGIKEPLRSQIVSRSRYDLTLANLKTIMGEAQSISLNQLKTDGPEGVYEHVLDEIQDYLREIALDADSLTIDDQAYFAEIVTDVGIKNADVVEAVAAASSPSLVLQDASETDPSFWPALVRAKRFVMSATNVAAYMDQHGVDEALKERLTSVGALEPNADESALAALGLRIVNENVLTVDLKTRLVSSLGVPAGGIAPADIEGEHHDVIPSLVRIGVVTDDEDAWKVLADDNYDVKGQLIAVSKAFPSYMISLPLLTNDMRIISWDSTPVTVKRELLRHPDELRTTLGKNGANGLAAWASKSGEPVSIDAIEILASSGELPAAVAVVHLIQPHAASMDGETLRRILTSLGGVYADIATPGKDRPRPPAIPGMLEVLERLRAIGVVSKFEEDAKNGVFRVSKHHS